VDPPDPPFAGRYRLIHELGVGGAGTVWRAQDLQDGGECAVKIVEDAGSEGRLQRRMVREASILAGLDHPNLVRVLDYGTTGARGYMAMELVDGPNLHELVELSGAVEPERAVRLVLDMLAGLQAAHDAGIVHRDVKPSNAMIGADGRALLSDFGIARDADATTHLTATGTLLGTYAFAAPEQLEDPRNAGPQADVYAAGATLAYLVTARMPFGLHDTHRQEEVLSELPSELARVIRLAVSSAPEDRPDGAEGLARALRGESPPGPGRPGVLAAGVAAVLLLGVGGLLALDPSPALDPVEAAVSDPVPVEVLPGLPAPAPIEGSEEEPPAPRMAVPEPAPSAAPAPTAPGVDVTPSEALAVADGPESSEDDQDPDPLSPVRVVLNSVPYSEVTVDDRPWGRTPLRIQVEPGSHRVLLVTEDDRRLERTIDFQPGMASPWCWDFNRQAACGS